MSAETPQVKLSLKERIIGLAMMTPIVLSRALPYRWRIPFAGWLTSSIVAPIAGYNKRVRDNLAMVCPELSQEEVHKITREVTNHAGRNIVELFSPEFVDYAKKSPIVGPGKKEMFEALEAGKPVIYVTAHFGSFNASRLTIKARGVDLGVFYRPMSNGLFNPLYIEAMRRLSEPMFEQGRRGMMQMVKHVKSGGVLAILNDLKTVDGVPLEFFGQPALTSLATAEIALKFDALLVPAWGFREADGLNFKIYVEEPIPASDPVTMTRAFNDCLERAVRQNMGQWFWVHRRWKDNAGPEAERGRKLMKEIAEQSRSDI